MNIQQINGNCIINGVKYSGKDIKIVAVIDGVIQDQILPATVNVVVEGDVDGGIKMVKVISQLKVMLLGILKQDKGISSVVM